MISPGKYHSDSDFDIDHEINLLVDNAKDLAVAVKENYKPEHAKVIIQAMIHELLYSI